MHPATEPTGKDDKKKSWSHPDREWEVRSAMENILRAREHMKDGALMKEIKKQAGQRAKEMDDLARRASALAKSGRISDKAMAKMKASA
jgi:hypothetical protein